MKAGRWSEFPRWNARCFHIAGAFAELEREIIRERVRARRLFEATSDDRTLRPNQRERLSLRRRSA
jgi:DNA invertase Pin-like site-specific DNA recombinase